MFIAPIQIVIDITHKTYQLNFKSELLGALTLKIVLRIIV